MNTTVRAVMVIIVIAAAAALSACIIPGGFSQKEYEPNDSGSESNWLNLTTGAWTTVYAELSPGSDTTDCFHFVKGSESVIELEIITMDDDMYDGIGYTLTGGASPVYGYSAGYRSLSGQGAYTTYDLTVKLDYEPGGRYVIMIKCRS